MTVNDNVPNTWLRGRAHKMLGDQLNCDGRTHNARIACLTRILFAIMEHFQLGKQEVRLKYLVWALRSVPSEDNMQLVWETMCAVAFRKEKLDEWKPKLLGEFEQACLSKNWKMSITVPVFRRERPDPRSRRPPEHGSPASEKIREAKQTK